MAGPGIRFNEHLECDDGETVFRHACKMGLEGIVSKRKDSTLPLWPVIRLAQDEEPGLRSRAAGGEGCGRGRGGGERGGLAALHNYFSFDDASPPIFVNYFYGHVSIGVMQGISNKPQDSV